MKTIIVATGNTNKFREIQSFFKERMECIQMPKDLPQVEEDCLSFVGNALKKAKQISLITRSPVLADDSGLSVRALDGRPGVFSARYAGPNANDDQNNQKLLQEIKKIPESERQAQFICSMVLYFPEGRFFTSLGTLDGTMIEEYRGKNGFGYDPIFYMPDRKCTLAEVSHEEKIKFSHRGRALENLMSFSNLFS